MEQFKIEVLIGAIILTCFALWGWSVLVSEIKADIEMRNKEGFCVSKYIGQGIERKDIKTIDGKCYLINRSNGNA